MHMSTQFTRAEYDQLPEGFPAQLIGGMLVREAAPTYGHNLLVTRIMAQLIPIVGPDRIPASPGDVAIDEHNVYQPDVVVPREVHDLGFRGVRRQPDLALGVGRPELLAQGREVALGATAH